MNIDLSLQAEETKPMMARPERYEVKLPMEITHNAFVGTRRTQGVCSDINEYGMGADVPQPLLVGEIVQVALEFPFDRLNTFARVVYRNDFHYGFYFVDMDEEQQQTLDKALMFLQGWQHVSVQ